MKDLPYRIRQARRRVGHSQAALAAVVGVNRSAVAQWERPEGSRPNSANLEKLAQVTTVQFEWLATGRGRMCASGEQEDTPALALHYYAHDVVEERVLLGLRKLDYWQTVSIAELVESLGRKRLVV